MITKVPIARLLCLIVLLNVNSWINGELFSSTTGMEELMATQKSIIDNLAIYIHKEKKRLNILKRQLQRYKTENDIAQKDPSDYIENPINAFTLIKRLTIDLYFIEKTANEKTEYQKNMSMKYPTQEDMQEAAVAVARLQATYNLSVTDLANGILKGNFSGNGYEDFSEVSMPMSASDCFELGRALYMKKYDYNYAIEWLKEALNKYKGEVKPTYAFTEADIVEKISEVYFTIGDIQEALEWNERTLTLKPQDPNALKIKQNEKIMLKESERQKKTEDIKWQMQSLNDSLRGSSLKNKTKVMMEFTQFMETYESLCRGDISIPSNITKRLKCRYLTKSHPFLTLTRVKTEQLFLEPDVLMFYDLISDKEIEHVIELAKPNLENGALIWDPRSAHMETSPVRVAKVAFHCDQASDVIARLSRRASDVTGLSIATAERLQTVSYAVGGFFGPHLDYSNHKNHSLFESGNRIATLMFYLSDVTQGGATVFTELGLSVFPVKRAALFWMNLLPSGEGDQATRHASCPVMRGSKWISSKWFHEHGQELLKYHGMAASCND